jgi:PTH1 family peptidyl-tRNA hydrolase
LQSAIRLVAGLGNPGAEYAQTRHNAGFWLVDALAERERIQLSPARKFFGETGEVNIAGLAVHLLKPSTFMNRSGRAVAAMANFYKIGPDQLLVVHDEIDLPPGVVRLKRGGGSGGHNGLRDVIESLGNEAGFLRLRIGVGRPERAEEVIDYVLRRPPETERALIRQAIDKALAAMPLIIAGEVEKAMQRLHTV